MKTLAEQLVDAVKKNRSVAVAFSGGVDSSVVAKAAHLALGNRSVAVTALSPSVSAHQVDWAKQVAAAIGIRHELVHTRESERVEYRRNDSRRCFYCKQSLFGVLAEYCRRNEIAAIASGTNYDDLGDFRPGIEAGDAVGVITPLADLGIVKTAVRDLAYFWELPNWDLPAAPCLASRIAYGTEVTPERLQRIENAEQWLRGRGIKDCRVRVHPGELARVEIEESQLHLATERTFMRAMSEEFTAMGFHFVTLDMGGLRSGSLNSLVQIDTSGR